MRLHTGLPNDLFQTGAVKLSYILLQLATGSSVILSYKLGQAKLYYFKNACEDEKLLEFQYYE